jgi:hypothetical protein
MLSFSFLEFLVFDCPSPTPRSRLAHQKAAHLPQQAALKSAATMPKSSSGRNAGDTENGRFE